MARLALRCLGRTDVEVSPLGLGCWRFGGSGEKLGARWTAVPQPTVDAIVAAALAGGATWFDTAEIYGRGQSERALAHALRAAGKVPGEIAVATKWWPAWRFAGSVRRTLGARLAALTPYPIDLHQVHHPTSLSSIGAQMAAFARLAREGSIRAVGVSNFSARQLRAAHAALASHGLPLAANQVRWSLADRRVEADGTVAAARELGVTIIAYSPLGQGLLSTDEPGADGPRPRLARALADVAAALGATRAQVALAWLLAREDVVAIPGATRVEHAAEALGALGLTLDAAARDRLDEASRAFL
ncbi:MAG TPA: aldo/keto reductase [Polyangia bacterium]|nr:aldo/keto reductase [Polyangia bacterium]